MDINSVLRFELKTLQDELSEFSEDNPLFTLVNFIPEEMEKKQIRAAEIENELNRRAAENEMRIEREPAELPKVGQMFLGGPNDSVVYIVREVLRTAQGVERKFFNEYITYDRIVRTGGGRSSRGRSNYENFIQMVEKGL